MPDKIDLVRARGGGIVVKHDAYLAVAALHHLWQQWGFCDCYPADRWIAMVLNRCLEPVTKIDIKERMAATFFNVCGPNPPR